MDAKKQFIEKATNKLNNFYELLREIFLTHGAEKKDEIILKLREQHNYFKAILEEIHNEMRELDIEESDDEEHKMQKAFAKIVRIFESPKKAMDHFTKEKAAAEERASKIREKEPVGEGSLGSVEIKGYNKEELEEKLFKAHEKKQQAISAIDKEQAQKEIDHLLRLYKDAALKGGLKKKVN